MSKKHQHIRTTVRKVTLASLRSAHLGMLELPSELLDTLPELWRAGAALARATQDRRSFALARRAMLGSYRPWRDGRVHGREPGQSPYLYRRRRMRIETRPFHLQPLRTDGTKQQLPKAHKRLSARRIFLCRSRSALGQFAVGSGRMHSWRGAVTVRCRASAQRLARHPVTVPVQPRQAALSQVELRLFA